MASKQLVQFTCDACRAEETIEPNAYGVYPPRWERWNATLNDLCHECSVSLREWIESRRTVVTLVKEGE